MLKKIIAAGGAAATDDSVLSDAPPTHRPRQLPDPWLYDTSCLVADLDSLRELVLRIPLHNDTFTPANIALSAIWDLREKVAYLVALHAEMQQSWARKTRRQPRPPTDAQESFAR